MNLTLLLAVLAACCCQIASGQPTTRTFTFDIKTSYVPLIKSLKEINTALYNTWPAFDKHLPNYATIASTHADLLGNKGVLMSQPIHVIEGDILEVTLINHLDSTGLSIHWHGFEMMNSLEYDGVVGITQCALAPQETMVYRFQVDETPGTYWYHTHSGALGVNAKNEIKAPLIVHPRSAKNEAIVNELNGDIIAEQGSFDALNFYDNERLLFFADGYLVSESHKLLNHLDSTGLSIHWHGFEMMNSLEYDGVVGITQCALAPQETMVYRFQVDETPGTYWYHTHSGALGVNAKNEIKAPLIVHPRSAKNEAIVNELNGDIIAEQGSFDALNFYDNERLLFFADGYLVSESHKLLKKVGGLNPPVSKNDDGFTVGSFPYHYGTCNGKLREVIPVEAGQKYKFRLLNGGTLYGFRISIDGLSMTIVAADSEPVVPYEVDEVILHSAERFDVEIDIPLDMVNTTVWIRADTLESIEQGYQNGVRAILNVMPAGKLTSNNNSTSSIVLESPMNISDPIEDIVSSGVSIFERRTVNCNSRSEVEQAENSGECLPITELAFLEEEELNDNEPTHTSTFTESHTVDFEFSPPPAHAHFVRIDGGLYNQHVNPFSSHFLDTGLKLHENTAMLHVSSFSPVLIVWRTRSLMDHPIHLHGYKMEVLDIYRPERELHCSRAACELPTFYDSEEKLQELDARINHGVLKDTFILPAGGAVVTRIQTFQPAVWFAHCHLETHREDGMALILNVGNYTAPQDSSWLPDDFPSCDHPFLEGFHDEPACACYQNKDAVLDLGLTEDHRCSRNYLCSHVDSEVSQLSSYKPSGVSMRSQYRIPNFGLTLVFLAIIIVLTFSVIQFKQYIKNHSGKTSETMMQHSRQSLMMRFKMKIAIAGKKGISHLLSNETSQQYFSTLDFWTQLHLLFASQFKAYRPGSLNLWRIFEVLTLATLVGLLFYNVGNKESSESLAQKSGLLFFSVTLWTFTRMYPAVGSTSIWRNLAIDFSKSFADKNVKMKYVVILWLARVIVVFVCESWLPLIHVLVAYPMAGMFGRIDSCLKISMFLMMNNLCYISIGSFLGAITSNVSIGMIVSTLVSQTSLLAAGFYTTLPPVINLLRYISPVTYTYTGILKSSFRSSDTFKCMRGGQSDVGANQCYIEQSVGIDILKRRGINVATFNDPYTESIWMEVMILFGLYVLLNCAVLAILLFKIHRRKEGDADMIDEEDRHIARVVNSETPVDRRSSNWANASVALERENQLDLAFLADVTKYDEEQSNDSPLNLFLDRESIRSNPELNEKEEVGTKDFLPEKKKKSFSFDDDISDGEISC